MKISKLFLLILAFFFSAKVHAQAPQSINYQAVVRDAGGIVVVNKVVSFRLSILTGGSTGNAQYIETHSAATNAFGLVTLNIGLGTPTLGTMANVAWATGGKFLRVEVDINGGTNFTVLGTTQFLSVPYALYAATSGSSSAASGWLSNGNTTTTANYIGTNNTDDLRFYTEGSQKMVLKTNGNVGIGTQSPTNRLHIEGNEDGFGESERVFFRIKNNSTSSAANVGQILQAGTKGTFTGISHHSSTYTVSENSDDMGQVWSTGKGLILRASPAASNQDFQGSVRFYTGWNPNSSFASYERMRVEANGNVGIGTTAPKAKLEVTNGDVYVNDATRGIILKAPNGSCWRVTIDNTGNFVRTAITCPN